MREQAPNAKSFHEDHCSSETSRSITGRRVMPSSFTVHRAAGYEQLMGRWSRKLAGPFLTFAGVANGERVLDVGCGTGSLTFALPKAADVSEVAGSTFHPSSSRKRSGATQIRGSPSNRGTPAPSRSPTAISIVPWRFSFSISFRMPRRRLPRCAAWCGLAGWSRRPCGTTSAGCRECA